ncbi:MAG: DedA family protein [Bdellovibrionales bacterium]|nr:DedA family protein [Bdellovibrionales bacterium]
MEAVWDLLVTFFVWFWDVFMQLDQHLNEWATWMGPWLYVLLFAIVFAETGFVVTPFLPGDSLLFAVGALSALPGSPIQLTQVIVLLIIAGVLGDAVNYSVGRYLGPKVFTRPDSWFLNKQHLTRAQRFYERHGGKTIILARFVPIVRTFAPFVAGVGEMTYRRFAMFNVTGAVAWVTGFTVLGFFFGNLPVVKRNFQFVILGIIFVSVIPVVVEFLRTRRETVSGATHS